LHYRHHLTPQEQVKKPSSLDKVEDLSMSSIEFTPEQETMAAETKH